MALKFIFVEDNQDRERERTPAGDVEDRRISSVAVIGDARGGGRRMRALTVPMGAKVIAPDRNLGDELEEELKLLPAPDTIDDVPDDGADLGKLREIYKRNPQILAKFIVEIGLEVVPPSR